MTHRDMITAANWALLWVLLTLIAISEAHAEELYCKIHDRTVLTRFSDGSPDTIQMHLGCTTVPEGQKLLKIEYRPISKDKFNRIFVNEEPKK